MVRISSHSQLSQHLSSSLIPKVLKMFMESFESSPVDNVSAVSFGRALIHLSWKFDGAMEILGGLSPKWPHWSLWRNLYLPWALEHSKTSFRRMKETGSADPLEQMDNTRTALRMALGARMDKFVNPGKKEEYIELVWHDKVGSELNLLDVDWLMDCAKHFHTVWQDFDAAGDALLLLTDLKNISQDSIVPFLNSSPRSTRLRHCALRAACRAVDINSAFDPSFAKAVLMAVSPSIQRSPLIDIQRLVFVVLSAPSLDNTEEFHRLDCKRTAVHIAYRIRQDLAMITGTPSLTVPVPLQTDVLSKLSPALFTMWLPRLEEDCHIKRCIDIIPVFCDQPPSSVFYLAGIFLRIEVASGTGLVIKPSQWWDLTRMAWHVAGRRDRNDGSDSVLDDGIDILEALVTTTKSCMPKDASASDLESLRNGLGGAILKLESRQPPPKEIMAKIKDLKDMR
ncbi:hypothetical protein BDR07DRAFT_1425852, partial [Suillus spraguei]